MEEGWFGQSVSSVASQPTLQDWKRAKTLRRRWRCGVSVSESSENVIRRYCSSFLSFIFFAIQCIESHSPSLYFFVVVLPRQFCHQKRHFFSPSCILSPKPHLKTWVPCKEVIAVLLIGYSPAVPRSRQPLQDALSKPPKIKINFNSKATWKRNPFY